MSDRFWVGGGSSANWNATGNTNWGTASNTRDNASVPGLNDRAIFDGSANGNTPCTVTNATVQALIFSGTAGGAWANTLSGTGIIIVNTGSATSVVMSATMTNSWTGGLTFSNGVGTTAVLTSNTKGFSCQLTISQAGTVQLADAFSDTSLIVHTSGTFDTNNQTMSVAQLTSTGALARTLNLGSSQITCIGSVTGALTVSGSNLTINANTASFLFTGATCGANISYTGGLDLNGSSIVYNKSTGAGALSFVGGVACTFKDYSENYAPSSVTFNTGSNITFTGTVTKFGGTAYRPLIATQDFPLPANIRLSTAYGAGANSTGTTATGTGTLDLPAEADVKNGVVYDNTTKTGTYALTSSTASSVSSDDYDITQLEQCTISATISNSPTGALAVVNNKAFEMANTIGTTWAVTLYGYQIGTCTGKTITVAPYKSAGGYGTSADAPSTMQVTASTAKTKVLLDAIRVTFPVVSGYTVSLVNEESDDDATPIISSVKISKTTYSETEIDNIRTLTASNYGTWVSAGTVTSCDEFAAPLSTTDSIVYFEIQHI